MMREKRSREELTTKPDIKIPANYSELTTDQIVKFGEDLGKYFSHRKYGITTSQLRNAYGAIGQIKLKWEQEKMKKKEEQDYSKLESELVLLKPKIAYDVGRVIRDEKDREEAYRYFKEILDKSIDGVKASSQKDIAFKNFFELTEAIVAYHKYYGGR